MWGQVTGGALGAQPVCGTFFLRHLFSWKNAMTFIFCLLTALGSVWGPVTTASEINAHLSASSCHYHLVCSQVSLFHLGSLAQCPVISIERVFYLQACTTLCSKMSKNGSKVAVPYNTGCHKSCIPLPGAARLPQCWLAAWLPFCQVFAVKFTL